MVWYNDTAAGIYDYSLLYKETKEGLYWSGAIIEQDTFVRPSLFIPNDPQEGDSWDALTFAIQADSGKVYVSDSVTMEVTNGDTLIETPLGDIACLEISYDFLNSAQRSISNDVILYPGGVARG